MLLLRLLTMNIGNDHSRRSGRPLAQRSSPHVMIRIAATKVRALVALTSWRCPAYIAGMAPKTTTESAKRRKVDPSASASDGKEATEIRSACHASAKEDAMVPVQVPAVDMPSPPCFDASNAQGPPTKPALPESRTDADIKVRPLMRSIIAYIRFTLKQSLKENGELFSAFPDVPLHEHAPLCIGDTQGSELKSYKAPWTSELASVALKTTDKYGAGGNVFWITPFQLHRRKTCWLATPARGST